MSQKEYTNFLADYSQKNFEEFEKYFQFECKVFYELKSVIFEINNCLILELNRAALTLTNFLLERLLKITLIYNEAGIGPLDTKEWNRVYATPHKKCNKLNFGQTIEKCRHLGLIDDGERKYLDEVARNLVRNGFSQADSTKITDKLPKHILAYQSTFDNPTKIEEITFERAIIPTFQAEIMRDFAQINAKIYFKFAYNLIPNIEKKLEYFKNREK